MYEKRILNFLKKHPKLKVTHMDLARLWKRNEHDIWYAAQTLFQQQRLNVNKGVLSLA